MEVNLAIVGAIRAGKTVGARLLEPYGYTRISLSEWIRPHVISKRQAGDMREERQLWMDIGDEARKTHGEDFLAREAYKRVMKLRKHGAAQKIVFDGIKNPGEILFLKQNLDVKVIGVLADEETRLQRAIEDSAGLDQDADAKQIKDNMRRDMGINQGEYGQNISKCMEMADITVENNDSATKYEERLVAALAGLGIENNH